MAQDPELRERLQQAQERQDAYLAQRVEAGARGREQQPAEPVRPEVSAAEPMPTEAATEATDRTFGGSTAARRRAESESEVEQPSSKKSRVEAADDAVGELPLPQAGADETYEDEPNPKRTRFTEAPADDNEDDGDPIEPTEEVGLVAAVGVENLTFSSTRRRRGKYDVCEAFSPPRVALRAQERGLRAGWSLDILHEDGRTKRRWDLSKREGAEEAFRMVERDRPQLVTLSPPCTKFCALWHLVKHGVPRHEWLQAVRMVNVAVRIAELQLDGGRHFVFEHPLTASSWKLPSLRRLRARAGVTETTLHMCMFGLVSRDAAGEAPAKKPTRVLTSSEAIRDKLARFCSHQHRHVQLISGRAAAAQEYTVEFVDAILDGLQMELLRRGEEALAILPAPAWSNFVGVVTEKAGDDGHVDPEAVVQDFFVGVEGSYVDNITGDALEPELVQAGRRN